MGTVFSAGSSTYTRVLQIGRPIVTSSGEETEKFQVQNETGSSTEISAGIRDITRAIHGISDQTQSTKELLGTLFAVAGRFRKSNQPSW